MNKKVNLLVLIVLAVFVFGIARQGDAQEHSQTTKSSGTLTATSDVNTPEISLSTDRLEFDITTGKKIVQKTLVISNIGTGILTVQVSGLEVSVFRIFGRSNFGVLPGMKHFLMVYAFTNSFLSATEGMVAEEHELWFEESNGTHPDGSDDIKALQGKILAAGTAASTKMKLTTNDPNHPVEEIEILAPLVPEPSATLKIEGSYRFALGCDDDSIVLKETGEIPLNFLYLPDKQHYNIVCDGDTCKGVTNAYGTFVCQGECTFEMRQDNIQWIINGSLSADTTKLTLMVYHASEPAGSQTVTCPNGTPPITTMPWSLVEENFMYETLTMDFKEGAEKTVSMGAVGEKTYTLISVTE